jgi:large subunit ribosomal protein L28
MSQVCEITNVGVHFGNKVSHSQRKTPRKYSPNLQNVTIRSDILNQSFSFRVTTRALRTLEINGGLDNYLLKTRDVDLNPKAVKIKKQIKKAKGE